MLKTLGQSHICVLPPNSSIARKALKMHLENVSKAVPDKVRKRGSREPASPGLKLCVANGKICVLDVKENSSAEEAGIKRGDIVLAVNGLKLDPGKYSDVPWDVLAERMLVGMAGTTVKLALDVGVPDSKARELTLERRAAGGGWVKVGVMSRMPGEFEYKKLTGDIAYIYFSPFFVKQIMNVQKLVKGELKNARALVLDIRNNPGGMMMMPQALGGWLSDKALKFGTMPTRNTVLKLESYPQAGAFSGPIAIIVNEGSASASEIFAAGMQDNKRAVIVGETSSGKCLPASFVLLSGGYRLQTVFGDFLRINGERIEKKGVKPDIEVKITREDLLNDRDPVIEKAVEFLSKEVKNAGKK
jgi:carboxyl-terminal processing protease